MLVLSRRSGERIDIGGGVTVTILECLPGRVRIGIEAPPRVAIDRPDARKRPDVARPRLARKG